MFDESSMGKELFFRYNGNYFHMEQDNCYSQYKKLGISKNQEECWKKELLELLYTDIKEEVVVSSNFHRIEEALKSNTTIFEINSLIQMYEEKEDNIDTLSQVLYLEGIVRVTKNYIKTNDFQNGIRLVINKLTQKIKVINQVNVTVNDFYWGYIFDMSKDNYQDYIKERIKTMFDDVVLLSVNQ